MIVQIIFCKFRVICRDLQDTLGPAFDQFYRKEFTLLDITHLRSVTDMHLRFFDHPTGMIIIYDKIYYLDKLGVNW